MKVAARKSYILLLVGMTKKVDFPAIGDEKFACLAYV